MEMTSKIQHDWFRIAQAARDLSNPDITDRQRRSATIGFYRGFRSLALHSRDADLLKAVNHISNHVLGVM